MHPWPPAVGKILLCARLINPHELCACSIEGSKYRSLCFPQVVPFLCELSPRAAVRNELFGDVFARRRACTSRMRVARVSRSIGKSDTTAKRARWQVGFLRGGSTAGYGYWM